LIGGCDDRMQNVSVPGARRVAAARESLTDIESDGPVVETGPFPIPNANDPAQMK